MSLVHQLDRADADLLGAGMRADDDRVAADREHLDRALHDPLQVLQRCADVCDMAVLFVRPFDNATYF